jgi:hypothetical protein
MRTYFPFWALHCTWQQPRSAPCTTMQARGVVALHPGESLEPASRRSLWAKQAITLSDLSWERATRLPCSINGAIG